MSLVLKENIDPHSVLALWKISETEEELLSRVHLNKEEKMQFLSFKNTVRKMQWLAVRALLQGIWPFGGIPSICYEDSSKPYIVNFPVYLSVSHTAKMAAVIISDKYRVGIDIESIHPRIEAMADRFISPEEAEAIGTVDRSEKLHIYWGGKESLFKLLGENDIIFNEHFHIAPFEYRKEGSSTAAFTKLKHPVKCRLDYRFIRGKMLVWVVEK